MAINRRKFLLTSAVGAGLFLSSTKSASFGRRRRRVLFLTPYIFETRNRLERYSRDVHDFSGWIDSVFGCAFSKFRPGDFDAYSANHGLYFNDLDFMKWDESQIQSRLSEEGYYCLFSPTLQFSSADNMNCCVYVPFADESFDRFYLGGDNHRRVVSREQPFNFRKKEIIEEVFWGRSLRVMESYLRGEGV